MHDAGHGSGLEQCSASATDRTVRADAPHQPITVRRMRRTAVALSWSASHEGRPSITDSGLCLDVLVPTGSSHPRCLRSSAGHTSARTHDQQMLQPGPKSGACSGLVGSSTGIRPVLFLILAQNMAESLAKHVLHRQPMNVEPTRSRVHERMGRGGNLQAAGLGDPGL